MMFKQEGYDLMGAAFEVYNEFGYGMAEDVYQSALEVEPGLRQIDFVAQAELDIYFKGHLLNAKYRPDLLVLGEIVNNRRWPVPFRSRARHCTGEARECDRWD